jgi:hypothetical protein
MLITPLDEMSFKYLAAELVIIQDALAAQPCGSRMCSEVFFLEG